MNEDKHFEMRLNNYLDEVEATGNAIIGLEIDEDDITYYIEASVKIYRDVIKSIDFTSITFSDNLGNEGDCIDEFTKIYLTTHYENVILEESLKELGFFC